MIECINYECVYFRKSKASKCSQTNFPELCECHNDDPDSKEVCVYKRKLTDTFLK